MIFVSPATFAQLKPFANNDLLLLLQYKNPWQSFVADKVPVISLQPKTFLPADFYAKQLGFFCRQEIKFDKAVKIPFRFRLGSVEQCNWLEGKKR